MLNVSKPTLGRNFAGGGGLLNLLPLALSVGLLILRVGGGLAELEREVSPEEVLTWGTNWTDGLRESSPSTWIVGRRHAGTKEPPLEGALFSRGWLGTERSGKMFLAELRGDDSSGGAGVERGDGVEAISVRIVRRRAAVVRCSMCDASSRRLVSHVIVHLDRLPTRSCSSAITNRSPTGEREA